MAIRLNEDKEVVKMIKEGLKAKGGYCPCRLEKTEDNKCICKEFRDQMADPEFEGFIKDFSEKSLPKIYDLLEKYKEKIQVIIFKSREEADDYVMKR